MEHKERDVATCFICEQEMLSDALAERYCKLCGMIIEDNEEKFCCNDCESKFIIINKK